MSEQVQAPDRDTRTAEHQRLRAALKNRIVRSIASGPRGARRTIADPARAAEYVVNALMEWPEGVALLRMIVTHLDQRAEGT